MRSTVKLQSAEKRAKESTPAPKGAEMLLLQSVYYFYAFCQVRRSFQSSASSSDFHAEVKWTSPDSISSAM